MKKKEKKSKVKKQRKPLPKDIKISIESFVIVLITLGITLPIHFLVSAYSWCWTIFTWIAVFVPIGLVNFQSYAESKTQYTEEQKKIASSRIGLAMLWFWYLDIVFMAIFNKWMIATYILAGIALFKILFNAGYSFLETKKRDKFFLQSILIDFIVGVALSIYLIFIIEDDSLKTIVTSVVAAVYGGLLTLIGVAWTIRFTYESKKEDEDKRCIPLFSFNMVRKEPALSETVEKVCFSEPLEPNEGCEVYFMIENSNKCSFTLKRVFHDNKWVNLVGNNVILPSGKCIVSFRFDDQPTEIYLEIEDELMNMHYYNLKVLFLGAISTCNCQLHTVREIEKVDVHSIKMGGAENA